MKCYRPSGECDGDLDCGWYDCCQHIEPIPHKIVRRVAVKLVRVGRLPPLPIEDATNGR